MAKEMNPARTLDSLEQISRALEPTLGKRRKLAGMAADYADDFIESLPGRKAYDRRDCERLRNLHIGEQGKSLDELIKILETEVDRAGINPASGANFAYIPGGGIWASALGDFLAAVSNRYAGVSFASPGAVAMENQMIQWLCSLVGYPSQAHGNLCSGGSIANLIALQVARDASGIDSAGVRKSVVYATEHVHHCVHKSLHTIGLREAQFRTVPMNDRFQMNAVALRDLMRRDTREGLRPLAVVATAGTTDTGAIDPLAAIADVCAEHHAWFHVDAAYGGFFLLVDGLKEKFQGIERSDSVVIDPHKGMFLPFGIGVVLVRDAAKLLRSYSHDAPYMQDALGSEVISPADASPELSKHFRGLRMWLPLHLHGVAPFRAALEEKALLCRSFYEGVKKLGFETGPEPELSVALFRFPSAQRDAFNERLVSALREDGRCLFTSTTIQGEFWIRCAVLNFRTHRAEIELALQVIEENVRSLGREQI